MYQETQQEAYEKGLTAGTRQRKPGGGAKGKLATLSDKLLFVLYYYKTYPTFDVLGAQFDMARSKANENLHKLSPILHRTLVRLEMMLHREFKTPEDANYKAVGRNNQPDFPGTLFVTFPGAILLR